MKRVIITAFAILLIATPIVSADTLYLEDGKSISGEVKLAKDGSYMLRRNSGTTIEFDADKVICVEFAPTVREDYMAKTKTVGKDNADGHFQLALWCDKNDLRQEARAELRKTLAIDSNHRLARKVMGFQMFKGQWMTHGEVMDAKGFVEYNGSWVTPSERDWMASNDSIKLANKDLATLIDSARPSAAKNLVRIESALNVVSHDEKLAALKSGMLSHDKAFRLFCVTELSKAASNNEYETLFKSSLHDRSRDVRLAAVAGVQRLSQDSPARAEKDYIQATSDERAGVRIPAIDALGAVGSSGAVEIIVSTYRMTLGESARNHIALVKQHAYVEDYDVQVASWAATADPVIGVIQEGSVLDVKPLRSERVFITVEQRIIRDTFQKITGSGIPEVNSLEEFDKWWSDNRLKYTGN